MRGKDASRRTFRITRTFKGITVGALPELKHFLKHILVTIQRSDDILMERTL